jgi:hypothetical protein
MDLNANRNGRNEMSRKRKYYRNHFLSHVEMMLQTPVFKKTSFRKANGTFPEKPWVSKILKAD